MKRSLLAACVLASIFLSSTDALAENTSLPQAPTPDPETATKTSEPIAEASGPGHPPKSVAEQAAAEYRSALASYAKGDLPTALLSMRNSYRLSQRPELLYNLGRIEEELDSCSDALEDYRQYLALVPHGNYRVEAERSRTQLELRCPPPASAPFPATPIEPEVDATPTRELPKQSAAAREPSYWTVPRVIGWSAIATGALAGVGALYFTLEAVRARNDFQMSVDEHVRGGPDFDLSIQDRQHRDQTIAQVLATTGGVLVTGGALTLILAPRPAAPRPTGARIIVQPGLFGASYSSSF